ncbi:multi drug ABC transporter permease protein, partial [mine drainage metagenome]
LMFYELKKVFFFFSLNLWNSKAFHLMTLFTIFIGILMSILTLFSFNSIIGSFIPSQNLIISVPLQLRETVFNFIWGNILIYMPILATTFFAAGVISYELEQKTIYPLMSLPLSKEVILMGKLLSSFLATATVITIYILIQLITYVIAFGTFPSISFASYYSIALLV